MSEINLWERNKSVRRKAILNAARKIILEGDVAALSMRGLAARANVSVRTIYNLIGSQNDVLAAIVSEMVEVMLGATSAMPHNSPIERLEMLAMKPVRFLLANPRLYKPALRVIETIPAYNSHQLFEPHSLSVVMPELRNAIELGLLMETTPTETVAQLIFQASSRASGDWATDVISDEEYCRRVMSAMYIALAAFARPDVRTDLLARLAALLSAPETELGALPQHAAQM